MNMARPGTNDTSAERPRLERVEISGYRPFSGFVASPGPLTVLIGANASGKSSLFDALRLLSFAAESPLPPEIDPRLGVSAALFHAGGPEQIDLGIQMRLAERPLRYEVSVRGPLGTPRITRELLTTVPSDPEEKPYAFLDFHDGVGRFSSSEDAVRTPQWKLPPNELALRRALFPDMGVPAQCQMFVSSWRFYGDIDVSPGAPTRRPAYIDEFAVPAEDGGNLSAVLSSLLLEHPEALGELEISLRAAIPGFESITVKPRGAKGMVIGVWRERGVKDALTLVDLSDGTLRLLFWLALAYSPNLPPVVCIDEPELGLHPRVLPILAGAFKLASSRAQLLISTHSPHFLSHFDLEDIAVMRKEEGRAVFVRPATSDALRREVEEIGGEAIAKLFLSEEFEVLP